MTSYLFFDLLIAGMLVALAARGYRKGLVMTVCGFLAVFVALAGGYFLTGFLTEPAAEMIEPALRSSISDGLATLSGALSEGEADPAMAELLDAIERTQTYQDLSPEVQRLLDAGTQAVVENASQSVAQFAAVQIARCVVFSICFAAVLFAWMTLSQTLDLAAKFPVLNFTNRWTGAAVGLAEGALLAVIVVWIFRDTVFTPEAVEGTYLLKLFRI